jgi:predicted nucleic acid-binding protein
VDLTRPHLDVGTLVLVDTSAYFALVADEGARHQTAVKVLDYLGQRRARLLTTSIILAETHALLLARLNRVDLAVTLFEGIYTSRGTTILRPTEADELAALALIKRYADKRFSLADALSFVSMERLGITHAFTFDRNFAQYGFMTLPPLDP